MLTEKPKILFVADEKLVKRLEDYRFTERINSKSNESTPSLKLSAAFWKTP
jgi:hypothetical protein